MKWTITVEEDPETKDLILPLPADLLEMQGWKEGDTLEWTDNNDGTWSLKKVENGEVIKEELIDEKLGDILNYFMQRKEDS